MFSAIIAGYINRNSDSILSFILSLIIGFGVLELAVLIYNYVFKVVKTWIKERKISEDDDEEKQELFYRKIAVQTTYVFSVVKRIQALGINKDKSDENITDIEKENDEKREIKEKVDFSTKEDLIAIYSMQGVYGIRKITVELCEIVFVKSYFKKKNYIEVIGKDNIITVVGMLSECLNSLKEYAPEGSIWEADKTRMKKLKQELGMPLDEE